MNGHVRIANGVKCPVTYQGSLNGIVMGVRADGSDKSINLTLSKVLVVPDIQTQLMSIHGLTEDGYSVLFQGNECIITHAHTGQQIRLVSAKNSSQTQARLIRQSSHTAYAVTTRRSLRQEKTVPMAQDNDFQTPEPEERRFHSIEGRLESDWNPEASDAVGTDNHVPAEVTQDAESQVSVPDKTAAPTPEPKINRLPTVLTRTEEAYLDLMHKRLGHLGLPGMLRIAQQGRLPTLQEALVRKALNANFKCAACIESCLIKGTPPKISQRQTTRRLELVHMDVMGPFHDHGKYKCALTIVDDFSRKVWAIPLTDQSSKVIIEHLEHWMGIAEKETGEKVGSFRMDGQFEKQVYEDWFFKKQIKLEFTAPYHSQQNGVAERYNRTLQERFRAMLTYAKLNQSFWAWALKAAEYHVNRSPAKAIDFKLPEELWTGQKVSLGEMKTFGCLAWVHVPQGVRQQTDRMNRKGAPTGKSALRAFRGVFLGYAPHKKAWAVYVPWQKDTIWVSTTVKFDEYKTYDPTSPGLSDYQEFPVSKIEKTIDYSEEEYHVFPDTKVAPGTASGHIDDALFCSPYSGLEEEVLMAALGEYVDNPDVDLAELDIWVDQAMLCDMVDDNLKRLFPEPLTFQQARLRDDWMEWLKAMQKELDALMETGTWEKVDKSEVPDGRAIGCKWVFKIKIKADGSLDKYKARLVARGDLQKSGIDYKEVFAPVARLATIRAMCAIAHRFSLHLESVDVVSAYLNGNLKEEIYMQGPPGFPEYGKFVRLRKTLYGLKQSGREWNEVLVAKLVGDGFKQCVKEPCLFVRGVLGKQSFVVIAVYVDNIVIASAGSEQLSYCKAKLRDWFKVTENGPLSSILGLKVNILPDRITICQSAYIQSVVEKFGLETAKSNCVPLSDQMAKALTKHEDKSSPEDITEYASLIGCLSWIALGTRPDIAFSVTKLSRFMANPGSEHFRAAKHVLRYLKGTIDSSLVYTSPKPNEPVSGYCDADFASDLSTRRSTGSYVFQLYGNTVSWSSKLQSRVSTSTAEAEYYSLAQATKEAQFISDMLAEICIDPKLPVRVGVDSTSAIAIAHNPEHHQRTKHFDIDSHYIRERIKEGLLQTILVGTDNNISDVLTKALTKSSLEQAIIKLGMERNPHQHQSRDQDKNNSPQTQADKEQASALTHRIGRDSGSTKQDDDTKRPLASSTGSNAPHKSGSRR